MANEWLDRVFEFEDMRMEVAEFLHYRFPDEAIYLLEKLCKFSEELYNQDKQRWAGDYAMSLNNLGSAYYNKGDIDKAIYYHEKSLAIREELYNQDKQRWAKDYITSLIRLGLLYQNKSDTNKAIYYYKKSLTVLEELLKDNPLMQIFLPAEVASLLVGVVWNMNTIMKEDLSELLSEFPIIKQIIGNA